MTVRALLVTLLALVTVACGGDDGAEQTLDALAADVGCQGCHSAEDTAIAPSLHGIWGTDVTLEDGSTVIVDEAYVRRSITDPGADVVEGYGPNMPRFPLDDEEVGTLVEWVRSLG